MSAVTFVDGFSLAWSSAAFLGGAVVVAAGTMHSLRLRRWRQRLLGQGLRLSTSAWRGIYRGRAVAVALHGNAVTLCVKTLNPARIVDALRSGAPVPQAPWLSTLAAIQLAAFVQSPGEPERWQLQVKDQQLELACSTAYPEQLRFLLDLACDVAEGVDRFGEAIQVRI